MLNLKYGDLLWMDTVPSGQLLYMVLRQPIECEHCHSIIRDWEKGEDDSVHCPECDGLITQFLPVTCSCGEQDLISLIVASNNNFHASYFEVVPYEHLVNKVYSFCRKTLEKEILSGKIKWLTDEEAIHAKEMIVWTHSDDYEPGKPIPQTIKDMFE